HGIVQGRVQNADQPRLAVRALLFGPGERESEVVPALRGRYGVVVLDGRVGDRRALFLELAQFGQLSFGLVGGVGWRRWHRDVSASGEHPGLPLSHFRTIADASAVRGECRDAEECQDHHHASYGVPLPCIHACPPFLLVTMRTYSAKGAI